MHSKPMRITIDDLGLFPEVETGVLRLQEFQAPLYCSWVTNYSPPSAAIRQDPFQHGLHFNIIEGPAHTKSSALADAQGNFSRRWSDFLIADKKLKAAVEEELKLQIEVAINWFGELSHFDSHLHLHCIPWIHKLMVDAKRKYDVPHIRSIAQPIFHSSTPWNNPVQILKLGILNSLSRLSGSTNASCFGLTELFQMKSRYCLDHLSVLAGREVIWHAAELPKEIALGNFRFIDQPQLQLRKQELEELKTFLTALRSPQYSFAKDLL